ncbi:glycine/sarcosine/betaine reductase component B subunit [Patescibacteria group bacterium]|nr:glycine/sarcosine/betaine reductase component B subunit [Patescibacteria group bacterium]
MILKMGHFFVKDVIFGKKTRIYNGRLSVNGRMLRELILSSDERIKEVKIEAAKPGESTRIVCIKDVIPVRKKIHGAIGEGRTDNLSNVVVTTLGQIISAQEGILDMSGPGADYSPFSEMINICLNITVKGGITKHEHEKILRRAGLRVADYFGEVLTDIEPDKIEVFDSNDFNFKTIDPKLPRVVYMYTLLAQGLLHHNYVDGHDVKKDGLLPCYVSPTQLLDGLIVSGNCVSACDKTTTWHHWNNIVIRELFKRHGTELNFVGVVLSSLLTNMNEKEEMAKKAVELVKELNPTAVIITKEGFGNPDADIMLTIELLEKAGIKTVSIHNEYSGEQGVSQPLADITTHANAIVSAGNSNEPITLPPMKKIIGPYENLTILAGAHKDSVHGDGSITVQMQTIYGATHQFGDLCLTCEEV